MTTRLVALTLDCLDPSAQSRFWSGVLGWERTFDPDGAIALEPSDDSGFLFRFVPTDRKKTVANQLHFDLTSGSWEEQRETVERALALGARHHDVGQLPEEEHVVLADPEGNEFCVGEPGNAFLANCGFLGALSCDGTEAVGHFWSEALGWPLTWDQDEETAIRSPHGGPMVTWGGPPLAPRAEKNRFHLDLAPPADGDLRAEVDRLLALGATHRDIGQRDVPWVVLSDPDGNEFCVRTPR